MTALDRRGRPPLPLGTYGKIATRNIGPSKYLARARYRRADGKTIPVTRIGQTKGEAERRLREELANMQQGAGGELGARTTVTVLLERWLGEIEQSERRPQTVNAYRSPARTISRRIGELRAAELTAGRCDALLRSIKAEQGPGAARNARKVLNGICGLAVRHGILLANPVRDTETINSPTKMPEALTREQVDDLTDKLRCDARAVALDLPDLFEMGFATGCRLGELLAIRDAVITDVGDAGSVEINATIVRIVGQGLILQPRPKTVAGWRTLPLPPYALALLRRRANEPQFRTPEGVIFPNPLRPRLRDVSQTGHNIKEVLSQIGYEWVTSHVMRKTVATRLDEAGLTAREIAVHLGQRRPSLTQDVYMGRRVEPSRAAEALDR